MTPNAFIGRVEQPTDEDLSAALGPARGPWDYFLEQLAGEHHLTTQEWTSYSPKAGWALRMKRNKRNIVYLSPCKDCFRVSFILGDRAIKVAREAGAPARILAALEEAKRYPEGSQVILEVKKAADLTGIGGLVSAKIAN